MNYKLNILQSKVDCNQQLIKDMPSIFFGNLDDTTLVFDSTMYYEVSGIDAIDHNAFARTNRRHIEKLAESLGMKLTELFYQNTDGHILIHENLVILFVMSVNLDAYMYLYQMMADLLYHGMAFGDTFITSMAMQRIPTDLLEEVVKNRKDNE